ncbi:MAG: phosphate signaling complex protein PhoU [Candidatus Hydrogenedentes bacterium]|nr:phosphate signaling complex protein PhoU [Candidatus Hydrogenedentota bacterium]
MRTHLQREIDRLKKQILHLGGLVEKSVHDAVQALKRRDADLADSVIEGDVQIDEIEVDIEEDCQKILALHQPVAHELRYIIAILKINNDLERVADLAVNVAERARFLATQEYIQGVFDFPGMAAKVQQMLRESLDALVNSDVKLAYAVCIADDEVDAINRDMFIRVQDAIRAHPDQMEALIHLLSVSRHLERIADMATNIAQDIIYMINGDIVRHHVEDYLQQHIEQNPAP